MVDTLVHGCIASIDISIDSNDQWYTNVITSYKQKERIVMIE